MVRSIFSVWGLYVRRELFRNLRQHLIRNSKHRRRLVCVTVGCKREGGRGAINRPISTRWEIDWIFCRRTTPDFVYNQFAFLSRSAFGRETRRECICFSSISRFSPTNPKRNFFPRFANKKPLGIPCPIKIQSPATNRLSLQNTQQQPKPFKDSLVLPVLCDGPEEVWVLVLRLLARYGSLRAVGDHHRLEVLGDARDGLDGIGACRAWKEII